MSQVKLLKIDSDGIPVESSQSDDITFNSFSVSGGAQSLSASGLQLGNTPVSGASYVNFTDPSTGYINQTAGNLIIDDIMAVDRTNQMTTSGEILFPTVANSSNELDNFQVPSVSGAPTATPTNPGEGFMVWDSVNDDLYVWTGTQWDSQSIVEDANRVTNTYVAGEALNLIDAVYISSADTVSKANASSVIPAKMIGFTSASAASAGVVPIVSEGLLSGFSGLTPGARYYLSTTAGLITTTIPTGSGHTIVSTGFAKNATNLQVRIEELGRRS